MVEGYKTLSLPSQMYDEIGNYIRGHQRLGYSSITDFVKDSVRKNLGSPESPEGESRVGEEPHFTGGGSLEQSLLAVYEMIRRPMNEPITFSHVVKASTHLNVVSVSDINKESTSILKNSLNYLTAKEYADGEPTELSSSIEDRFFELLEREAEKSGLTTKKSPGTGYPDFILQSHGEATFISFRVTINGSKQREFYYATSRKIKSDGEHLLIEVFASKRGESWKVIGYSIKDLSTLSLTLDAEFRASARNLGNLPILIKYPDYLQVSHF